MHVQGYMPNEVGVLPSAAGLVRGGRSNAGKGPAAESGPLRGHPRATQVAKQRPSMTLVAHTTCLGSALGRCTSCPRFFCSRRGARNVFERGVLNGPASLQDDDEHLHSEIVNCLLAHPAPTSTSMLNPKGMAYTHRTPEGPHLFDLVALCAVHSRSSGFCQNFGHMQRLSGEKKTNLGSEDGRLRLAKVTSHGR